MALFPFAARGRRVRSGPVSPAGYVARGGPLKQGAAAAIGPCTLASAGGKKIPVPDSTRLIHLQFRRFAGCAFCNVHLRSYEVRHPEIAAAGIREVVVFRSTLEQLRRHPRELPYDIVLDPGGSLYRAFGVEWGLRSLLDPRAAFMIVPNFIRSLLPWRIGMPAAKQRAEGFLGLPADFLIGTDGRLVASKYGEHAGDGWTVGELLDLGRRPIERAA